MSRDLHQLAALLNRLYARRRELEGRLRSVTLTSPLSGVRNLKRELSQLGMRIAKLEGDSRRSQRKG